MNRGTVVSILKSMIDPEKEYTRQEVARLVNVGWACVVEATKGDKPKLVGEKKNRNGIETWVFKGSAILAWRSGVDAHNITGLKQVIALESPAELKELQELLKGTKFADRI